MSQANYFSIRLKEEQPYDCMQRWHTPSGIALRENVIAALSANQDLPEDIPMLEAEFAKGVIKLVDLRGIDLSGLVIGEVDLTYCCFDRADFSGSQFEGTHLQYSSMNGATFNSARWDRVQASPISACTASFKDATIANSFLMHSHLDGADFHNAILRQTPLIGCMLGTANLSAAKQLDSIDTTQATLYDENRLATFNDLPTTLIDAEKLAHQIVNAWATSARMPHLMDDVALGAIAGAFNLGALGEIDEQLIDDVANVFGVQHYSRNEINSLISKYATETINFFDVLLPHFAAIKFTNRAIIIGDAIIRYMKARSPYK